MPRIRSKILIINPILMENVIVQRRKLEEQLVKKAMTDAGFREELIRKPKETVSAELGVPLPDGLTIRVLEEDRNNFYLVLPPKMETGSDAEMSEAELEQVAGGTNFFDTACSTWSWIVTQCDAC